MTEGSVLLTVRVVSATIVRRKYHPKRFPASDTISSPKSDMPASEPFISKGTIEYFSNCEFLLKTYHFLSFLEVAFIDKTYLYPNALRFLRANLSLNIIVTGNLSLNADVSEYTLPFVSHSINNFSDYDMSQSHDWHTLPKLFHNTIKVLPLRAEISQ